MKYADIIINITNDNLDRSFQYSVPEKLQPIIKVGMVVNIPFGNRKNPTKGYVIGLSNKPKIEINRIRPIIEIITQEETTESNLLEIAYFIKETYGGPMIRALKTVFPINKSIAHKEDVILISCIYGNDNKNLREKWLKARASVKIRLLDFFEENKEISYSNLKEIIPVNKKHIVEFENLGLIIKKTNSQYRNKLENLKYNIKYGEYNLQSQQKIVYDNIVNRWAKKDYRPTLIYGVTGSGKTNVYLELAKEVISKGKNVICLIPEISLTFSMVERFYAQFGDKIAVLHSKLYLGEKYDAMRMAKDGEAKIIIGARSALFAPFKNLGLIIIDEEHDSSYQSESVPCYDAREVAIFRGKISDCPVILGSATPSVKSFYYGKNNLYVIEEIKERYNDRPLPETTIVDMRQEVRSGNKTIISSFLAENIKTALCNNEQVILFLNRRGYNSCVFCRECGKAIKCPHCDVTLVQHKNGTLKCHYCGYTTKMVKACPSCGSEYIGGMRVGTQKIQEIIKKIFPTSRVIRMDKDTAKSKDEFKNILETFKNHKADVLIGTQMIVKGHDFPDVTVVGILDADLSLNSPTYRSSENTFQLITQAIGRAGRGEKSGKAIIQTYSPENVTIINSANQDYDEFYEEEIAYRKLLHYPPTSKMLTIYGECKNKELLNKGFEFIYKFVERFKNKYEIQIIGPTDQNISKINDYHKMMIIIKGENEKVLIGIKNKLEEYISINYGFDNINIKFSII